MTKARELKVAKMADETEQQYTAWLLYCEYGSIDKLMKAWEGMRLNATEMRPELAGFMEKLGNPPARTTLARWSKKFQWVKRTDLKLTEDLEGLREKTKKITREKKHRIAELFKKIVDKKLKQMTEGEGVTTHDVKEAWEMLQVETGKPTARGALKFEQKPLTPEEKERGKELDEAIEEILRRKQGRGIKHPVLDTRKQHKKRKGRPD